LRMAANELHFVRVLEAELSRLRTLREASAGQPVPTPTALLQAPSPDTAPPVTIRPAQTLVSDAQQLVLPAGSEALPEGLTLPPGWTMMPLQRVDGVGHITGPATSHMGSAPGNHQTTSVHSGTVTAHPSTSHPITSQPSAATDAGLAGLSVTPNPNIGQPRRTEQAWNRSNRTLETSMPGSTLMTGVETRPGSNSTSIPAATSNREPENAVPTTNHNQDPGVTLSSLPTWGSSAPLAAPVASRPTAPASHGEASTDGESTIDGVAMANGSRVPPPTENDINHHTTRESTASSSQDKGKAKTATVEDSIEDID